ncbi:hypothetical protein BV20DRAFT_721282 [Pilatotrama ljubarskyi]|nr:hypothetical protein BV20DRAFT_721282 [Pilatotrama ljubarskyi]
MSLPWELLLPATEATDSAWRPSPPMAVLSAPRRPPSAGVAGDSSLLLPSSSAICHAHTDRSGRSIPSMSPVLHMGHTRMHSASSVLSVLPELPLPEQPVRARTRVSSVLRPSRSDTRRHQDSSTKKKLQRWAPFRPRRDCHARAPPRVLRYS